MFTEVENTGRYIHGSSREIASGGMLRVEAIIAGDSSIFRRTCGRYHVDFDINNVLRWCYAGRLALAPSNDTPEFQHGASSRVLVTSCCTSLEAFVIDN